MVWHHSYISLSSNLDLFLHKNFLHPPSSSKSSTRPCSTTEPNKSTEHSEIQKGLVHCIMAATDAGRLLSTLLHRGGQQTVFNSSSQRYHLYKHFSFLKLVVKPDSLLLEDKSSQTSREGHNQSSALPLLFELDLVDHCDRKGNINVRSSREHCLQRSGTYSYQCISRKCFSSNMIAVEKMSSLL